MDYEVLVRQMALNAARTEHLVEGVTQEQARWKPAPDSWSILEVINHLVDEEREDFRTRLRLLLFEPGTEWPRIDPVGWVRDRRYNERELEPSLQNYLAERQDSLAWLRSLETVDWETSVQAPFGLFKAGDLFCAWAAHDVLHMRQLVELHWAYLNRYAAPYDPQYAGEW
jgi:hypothetical protein